MNQTDNRQELQALAKIWFGFLLLTAIIIWVGDRL